MRFSFGLTGNFSIFIKGPGSPDLTMSTQGSGATQRKAPSVSNRISLSLQTAPGARKVRKKTEGGFHVCSSDPSPPTETSPRGLGLPLCVLCLEKIENGREKDGRRERERERERETEGERERERGREKGDGTERQRMGMDREEKRD